MARSGEADPSTVHGLVQLAGTRFPDATAITWPGGTLSYRELLTRSAAVADQLQRRGVTTESRVVVPIPRSADFIITVLGVLMAGGAYVPVDPDYPFSRQRFIAEDCGAELVVVTSDQSSWAVSADTLVLSDQESSPASAELPRVSEVDLAYVIYTSGSTGTPKGVEITHADVVNLLTADQRLAVSPGQVVAQLAPTAFDISTFEIWSALIAGGTVAVVTESRISTAELGEVLREIEPDWLVLAAGLFHLLVEHDPDAVRHVGVLITGGDVLVPRYVRTAATLVRERLYAAYGPTEGTVFSSMHAVDPNVHHDRVPLGSPLAGKSMSVVGADGVAVPDGEPGEIWLGGAGIARGYHGRPELTAQRFVDGQGRRYRTGDQGRLLPNGEFDFLGRIDRQLKVRGFRVEPEEIELVLQDHPQVRAAAVVLANDEGWQRLVAYVSLRPESELRADDASVVDPRTWLVQRLPAYMHPNNIVALDDLPLDPNGKVNRAALPAPWQQRAALRGDGLPPYVEPVTEAELLAAGVFQDVLQIDRVGVHDGFFDLGGDSLRGSAALRQFNAVAVAGTITARQFYREPTVAAIARLIETKRDETSQHRVAR